jgi:hypothetical protein
LHPQIEPQEYADALDAKEIMHQTKLHVIKFNMKVEITFINNFNFNAQNK